MRQNPSTSNTKEKYWKVYTNRYIPILLQKMTKKPLIMALKKKKKKIFLSEAKRKKRAKSEWTKKKSIILRKFAHFFFSRYMKNVPINIDRNSFIQSIERWEKQCILQYAYTQREANGTNNYHFKSQISNYNFLCWIVNWIYYFHNVSYPRDTRKIVDKIICFVHWWWVCVCDESLCNCKRKQKSSEHSEQI